MVYNMFPISAEQLLEISRLLKVWREERRLTSDEQIPGLANNIAEEVAEFREAKLPLKKVCELCDIVVFCLNALGYDKDKSEHAKVVEGVCENANVRRLEYVIHLREGKSPTTEYIQSVNNFVMAIADMTSRNLPGYEKFSEYDWIHQAENVLAFTLAHIDYLGFNPYIALLEVCKKINSRTGSWSSEANKWIKDTSEEAKSKWYEPNYRLARYEFIKIPDVPTGTKRI